MAASLSLSQVYLRSFEARPNVTLAFTGGCLQALGDAVAQITQNVTRKPHEERLPYDPLRTLRFFVFGFATSPLIGKWNVFLERKFPLKTHVHQKVSFKSLGKRVACDQIVWAPIGLGAFLGGMSIMEGCTPAQIREKFSDLYKPLLITNWQVWPLAQVINFRFMPIAYRVPFQSTCGVFWTLYLSLLNAKEDQKQHRGQLMHETITKE
ncbi:hypothetical protein EV122DRAFT_260158 [Schizophyllum commune]|nr:hypothetical protein K523DRAFT_260634 [Schizophyllum commune Tattone D]